MNAVNAVQLCALVWTFTAACQADVDISVSCEDVTGTVDEEVTLTCSVSLKSSESCIKFYKFQYPEKYNDSAICREEFPQDCERRNSFTCRFSPTTVMMEQFRFFVQTTCGHKYTEFTVDITETSKPEASETDRKPQILILTTVAGPGPNTGGSKNTVIAPVVGCFIFIIIIMTIIYKKKPNCSKSHGFQRMFMCRKHEDNNSNFQEQNPENVI